MAAVDLIIGDKAGPGGVAFSTGLASQRQGHPSTIAVLQPNVAVKPSTLLVSRVTLTGVKSSVHFFDPVQQGVARAVTDAVADKVIAREKAEDLVVVVSVFIHAEAEDKAKLFQNNYEATKSALKRAMAGEPSAADVEKIRRKN
jgi:5,6,7,8-tetrahydromethanopterin hydro-lyase